ncbi:Uu.00g049150.m01.CDS01 [Anthostomella pinea]|uniref:Uu.00g049150.m01.CDS01 n=1 Tax=Anthostomella pinea TaxID=933095 RepID=A0AAI8VCK6_9PEZI|nr:Uu.00g049150.m01.CDS01 [Anthostomella pinea]
MAVPSTFHQFPHLPMELRCMVWDIACDTGPMRLHLKHPIGMWNHLMSFLISEKWHKTISNHQRQRLALLHTRSESRIVGLKRYDVIHGHDFPIFLSRAEYKNCNIENWLGLTMKIRESFGRQFAIDWSRDMVYFEDMKDSQEAKFPFSPQAPWSKIVKLGLNLDNFSTRLSADPAKTESQISRWLQAFLPIFANLQELTLTITGVFKMAPDELKDYDYMTPLQALPRDGYYFSPNPKETLGNRGGLQVYQALRSSIKFNHHHLAFTSASPTHSTTFSNGKQVSWTPSFNTQSTTSSKVEQSVVQPKFHHPTRSHLRKMDLYAQEKTMNYRGVTKHSASDGEAIPEDKNTSLYVTGLPYDVTYNSFFKAIRKAGGIRHCHLNPPAALNPVISAAKVVFFTRQAADKVFQDAQAGNFKVQGTIPRVVWNRIPTSEEPADGRSRVLRYTFASHRCQSYFSHGSGWNVTSIVTAGATFIISIAILPFSHSTLDSHTILDFCNVAKEMMMAFGQRSYSMIAEMAKSMITSTANGSAWIAGMVSAMIDIMLKKFEPALPSPGLIIAAAGERRELCDPRPTPGRKARPRWDDMELSEEFKARFHIPKPEKPKGRLNALQKDKLFKQQTDMDPSQSFHDLHVCHKKGARGSPMYDSAGFQLDYKKVDDWFKPGVSSKSAAINGMERRIERGKREEKEMYASFFIDFVEGEGPDGTDMYDVKYYVKDHVSKDLGVPWHEPNAEEKKRMLKMMGGASLRKDL